jgi:membrane-bound lytic murein transglycosylase B
MVKLALPLAALAMAASVAAAPAPGEASAAVSGTTFSFEAWVEDIIAHPDTALTVDEALAAAEAADVVGSAGGLLKRATCGGNFPRANVCLFAFAPPDSMLVR